MSIEAKIFEAIVNDLNSVVNPRVKRSLKMFIKERKEKEQKISLRDDLHKIRDYYLQQIAKMFETIEDESLLQGIMSYSGFVEPKEDDE